jgi:serine protease
MTTHRTSRMFAIMLSLASVLGLTLSDAFAAPPQRVIVKYRAGPGIAIDTAMEAQAIADAQSRAGVALQRVRATANGAQVLRLDREVTSSELSDLVNTLRANPNVEYAEEDQLLRTILTPNDTHYNLQWHYYENTAGIRAPSAWDSATGAGVTVAVIDTGYRPHVDLAANIVGGYDFISDPYVANDGNGRDSDASDPGDWTAAGECAAGEPAYPSSWHGTHVAGTVAALTNNSTGVAGVAFNAKVVPARVLGRCGGYTSDIADAIVWSAGGSVSGVPANAHPAKVLNLSLGGIGSCGNTMQNAINAARSNGAVVIVAAGNSNINASNATPANCSGTVVIAAVNRNGSKAYYSNYGSIVDLAAPGGDVRSSASNGVLSTLNMGTTTPGADAYAYYQGTSMAAPHVAGVAALMLQANPALTHSEIESLLKSSARSFPGSCSQCGSGIVDAAAAVAAAGGGGGGGSCPIGYTEFNGTLSSRSSAYLPSTSGYVVGISGVHNGQLTGPASADFDLYLQKRGNGNRWNSVASSTGTTSTENINYNGTSGTYRWRVYSYSGSGSYRLCTSTP